MSAGVLSVSPFHQRQPHVFLWKVHRLLSQKEQIGHLMSLLTLDLLSAVLWSYV